MFQPFRPISEYEVCLYSYSQVYEFLSHLVYKTLVKIAEALLPMI